MRGAYLEPVDDALRPLTAAELERDVFRKPPGWFRRNRNRKRLYAKGFPHPFERGLWSAQAVKTWLTTAGSNPNGTVPREGRRPKPARKQRPNAYAPVAEAR